MVTSFTTISGIEESTKPKKSIKAFVFLYGLFSTTQTLAIPTENSTIAISSILLVVVLFVLLVFGQRAATSPTGKTISLFSIWLMLSIISTVAGCFYFGFNTGIVSSSLSYIPKVISYLILFVLLKRLAHAEVYAECLLNGVVFGAFLNVCWAILDWAIYCTMGFSINNTLFSSYIEINHIRYGTLSLIDNNGVFRSGGFCADPANVGFFSALVFAVNEYVWKRKTVIVVSLLGIVSSVSVLGLACIVIIACLRLPAHWKVLQKRKNNPESSWSILFMLLFIIAAIVLCLALVCAVDSQFLSRSLQDLIDRVSTKTSGGDSYRLAYYGDFIFVVAKSFLPIIITGSGFGTASYGYFQYSDFFAGKAYDSLYDPESVYISYFFDCGIIGFAIYILMLYQIVAAYLHNKELMKYPFCAILAVIIAGFFYHYTLYSSHILIIIAAVIIAERHGATHGSNQCSTDNL